MYRTMRMIEHDPKLDLMQPESVLKFFIQEKDSGLC